MNRKILFIVLALGGCAPLGHLIAGDSIATQAPATMLSAEKALTLTHLAYQGVGYALKDAAETGILRGPAAATAKRYYDTAGDALSVADQADAAANAQGIFDAISKANDAIVAAKAFTGAH